MTTEEMDRNKQEVWRVYLPGIFGNQPILGYFFTKRQAQEHILDRIDRGLNGGQLERIVIRATVSVDAPTVSVDAPNERE